MSLDIPLFELSFSAADREAVDEVLASGWVTAGARVRAFEEALGEALGVPGERVVAVASCTAALHLALATYDVGPGDEVIVPALTFVAASNVVLSRGATPIYADVLSLEEPNLDPESVAGLIGPRTRAVIPVHFAGYPCRMDALLDLARPAGIRLIEDSAHACVTATPSGACGTLADAGAFSFFSNKNLAVGEGGALVLSDPEVAARVRRLASHAMTTRTLERHEGHAHTYDVLEAGYNYRWDELRAALAAVRLARLPAELERRRAVGGWYRERLAQVPGLVVPFGGAEFAEAPPHIFPVLLPEGADRGSVMASLRDAGIQTSIHYPLLPELTVQAGSARGEWSRAAEWCARVLTLPLYPALEEGQVDRVVGALGKALEIPKAPAADPKTEDAARDAAGAGRSDEADGGEDAAESPPTIAELATAPALPAWKRGFDVCLALVGIVVGAPLLALIAVLVKLTSAGPVLFSQERYGLGGKRFRILKFRKMSNQVTGGDRVTSRNDYRMTPLGRVLERTKLDELPQLFNILRGEMSFVGPRPEDPAFADRHPREFARILATPPGVAGPNQIRFRNESELYPEACADRGEYYAQHILPRKIPTDLAYLEQRGALRDLWIFVAVLWVTVTGVLPLATLRRKPALLLHLVVVPLLIAASLSASFALHFEFPLSEMRVTSYVFLLAVLTSAQTVCFFVFTHQVVTRYFNVLDLRQILKAAFVGTGITLVVSSLMRFTIHSRVVLVLHTFLFVILAVFWLSMFRQLPDWWAQLRVGFLRRARITLAYAVLGATAFLMAYGLRVGFELQVFPYPLVYVVLVVAVINAAVFFLLQGFNVLNRIISFEHHYAILKIVAASSLALYGVAFLLDVRKGFPRSLFLSEPILKYSFALILKYALARRLGLGTEHTPRATLLVGTLDEVDRYLSTDLPAPERRHLRGIVLVGEFHEGMSIHSLPILGEVGRMGGILEQLGIERVLLLRPGHRERVLGQGVSPELVDQAPASGG
jgi:dTDP-4-amino-4,6-dideoxygalactose transaminase/lipopolysaccharide/colanic/teichoic acid biosynthesis glycosyltransferase